MRVIYVDTLFLLNAGVDYLLLLSAARLAGEPLRRLRFGAGAVLGGLYAVALFLPGLDFLGHPLCRLAAAALMLVTAYGGSRRLYRETEAENEASHAWGHSLHRVPQRLARHRNRHGPGRSIRQTGRRSCWYKRSVSSATPHR